MNECKENIYELKKNHSKLMEKTDEFQSKCGSILKDQKTLGDISEELTKSLDYYKEIDGISKNVYKKNAEILTPESNFPRTLIVLEDAEIFFSQNADYLDSKEYLAKISTVKMRISEIIQTYIQQVVTENYIQNLTNDPLTPETLETYKNYLYSSLEELDSVSNSLIVFQKFATEKSILGYLDTIESTASEIFSLRKGFISKLCDYLAGNVLKNDGLLSATKELLQIQAQMIKDELIFFGRYFIQIDKIRSDISDHFESLMYSYLRPLIIKENNIKDLNSVVIFVKKVFFEQSLIFIDAISIDKKFLAKVYTYNI